MKNIISICLLCFGFNLQGQQDTFQIKEFLDISYYNNGTSDSSLTKVNIIVPETKEKSPVMMWIGGGAWAYVNRHQEMKLCREIAKKGITVISVGHRLSPALLWEPKRAEGIQHPEHIKDVAKAFKWVYDNAETYGYNKEQIFVGGFSSGGHLCALLAADYKYLDDLGISTSKIRGIIPVSGGYDIPLYKNELFKEDPNYIPNHINPVFGETHEQHLDASPLSYVENLTLPILMFDEGETYMYNGDFEKDILKTGNIDFQSVHLYNETHAGLWYNLSGKAPSPYRDMILQFIERYKNPRAEESLKK